LSPDSKRYATAATPPSAIAPYARRLFFNVLISFSIVSWVTDNLQKEGIFDFFI